MKILSYDQVPHWLVLGLNDLATRVYKYSGQKGVTRVVLDADLAINLGLLAGQSMMVHTAAGYVEVKSEAKPYEPFKRKP